MGGKWTKENLALSFSNLKRLLIRIQEISQQFQLTSLNRQLEVCFNIFNQKRFIDVVIFGQFKAGKNSFLNSLIGRDILPVGVIPVTSAITRLLYGKKELAEFVRKQDFQYAHEPRGAESDS